MKNFLKGGALSGARARRIKIVGAVLILAAVLYFEAKDPELEGKLVTPRNDTIIHVGRADVRDGDSINFNDYRMRLHGIDALELAQTCQSKNGANQVPCGRMAKKALEDIIGGKALECHVRDIDRYDRHVVQCYQGRMDIGREMVARGWAEPYYKHGGSIYDMDYKDAKRDGRGAFQYEYQRASDYRQDNRR
jgi:endonuclease YncB( thermonuclease family)